LVSLKHLDDGDGNDDDDDRNCDETHYGAANIHTQHNRLMQKMVKKKSHSSLT